MKIKIRVEIEDSGFKHLSVGEYTEYVDDKEEAISLDKLAQCFVYAIPKHDVQKFSLIQIFDDGQIVGTGEV